MFHPRGSQLRLTRCSLRRSYAAPAGSSDCGWREGVLVSRPHPIHIVTLLVALVAAVFSFVAMQAAFDARDEARIAGELASTGEYVGPDIRELHEALLRAGLIEDTTGRFEYLSEELPQGDEAD